MKLPFSFGKKETKNYFLALLLQDEKVGSVVFEEFDGNIHVVSRAEEHFATSLEQATFEEWLENIDKVVSVAESSLPEGIQLRKTVFGVKQDWIEEGKIKKEYLAQLKKVCEELELQPIGFLVFTEAIIHLLQKEEGAPVSAILVEIGKKIITLSLIRAGRIIATKQIPFKTPVPHAIDEALKHFTDVEIFPSRIILFHSDNNEHVNQSFISHSWSRGLPFLHMPQITILPAGFDTKGILFGTATQMGFTVSQNDFHIPIKTITPPEEKAFVKEEFTQDEPEQKEQTAAMEQELATPTEHHIHPALEEQQAIENEKEPTHPISSDYFGFVNNGDVTETSPLPSPTKAFAEEAKIPFAMREQAIQEIPEEVREEETGFNTSHSALPPNSMVFFETIKENISKGMKHFSLKKLFSPKRRTAFTPTVEEHEPIQRKKLAFPKIGLLFGVIILLGIGGIIWYVTSLSAIVTVSLTPKDINDTKQVTFAVGGSNDFANNTIAVQQTQVDEQATVNADATGTKQTGTPAKGTITIFSRLTDTTNIDKGTVVTSSNGLTFTLDSAVKVSSFSGDTTDPSVTVANLSVTAKTIGPESNIPSGTKFSIDGLSKSDISGKNDSPFSGGTKKDITVVAQKDIDTLLSNAMKNSENKAKDDLSKNAGGNKVLLPFFTKEELTKKQLSKNVGDETKSVSLDGTVTYYGAVYDKNDITDFAKNAFADKVSSDMDLSQNSIQTDVSDIKQVKDTISATLHVKASLLPKLDSQKLIKDITAKSFTDAQTLIKKYQQVADVSIRLKPNLPFLPKLLPRMSKNIQLIINNE